MNTKPIELTNSVKGEYAVEVYNSEGRLKSTTGIQRNAIVDKYNGYKAFLDARIAKATELGETDLTKTFERTLYNKDDAKDNEIFSGFSLNLLPLMGQYSSGSWGGISTYATKQDYLDALPNSNGYYGPSSSSYNKTDGYISVGSSADDFEEYSSGVNTPLITIKDLSTGSVPSSMLSGTISAAYIEETNETIYTFVRFLQATEDCTIREVSLGTIAHSKIKDQSGYALSVDITPSDFVKVIYRLVFSNNVDEIIANKANYLQDVKISGDGTSGAPDLEKLPPNKFNKFGAYSFSIVSFSFSLIISDTVSKTMSENVYKSGETYLTAISKVLSDFLTTTKSKTDCVTTLKAILDDFSKFLGDNPTKAVNSTGSLRIVISRRTSNKNTEFLTAVGYYYVKTSEPNYVTDSVKLRLPIIPPSSLIETSGISPSFGITPVTLLMFQPNGDALDRNYTPKAEHHYYVPVPQIDIVYTAPYAANIYNWNLIYTETLDLFNTKYQETSNVAP